MSEVNGYEMFEDIADEELRLHNRAAVMYNIITGGGMTPTAIGKAMQYLHEIPNLERKDVVARLAETMGVKTDG